MASLTQKRPLPGSWILISLAVAVVIAAAGIVFGLRRASQPKLSGGLVFSDMPQAPDFSLRDQNGQTVTMSQLQGKVVALTFLYTRCPDVCPTTLAELKALKDQLGEDGKRLQVLFVTVDPERDTQKLLANYVPAFDPSFLGLYGDSAATARVAKNFRVFYQKSPGKTPDGYTVDHTAGSYVFDPQGRLRLFVRHGNAANLAADVRILLNASG